MLNELNKQQVINDLLVWLQQCLQEPSLKKIKG